MIMAPLPGRPDRRESPWDKAGQTNTPEPRSGELPSPPSRGRGAGGRLNTTTAARYDAAAVLAREVGRRMAERLDFVKIEPHCIADIGCATGDGIRELQRRYPLALALALDTAPAMLAAVRDNVTLLQRLRRRAPRCVGAAAGALPLADGMLDLAWSNLALHWFDDPAALPAVFAELHRVLNVGGLLMFSMFGPDTLKELRAAAVKVGAGDTGRPSGRRWPAEATGRPSGRRWPAEATPQRLLDMHDIGDMLVASGFADPVMDMEMITLTYVTPRDFLRDQRHLGVRDALLGARPWRDWRRVLSAWERAGDHGGRLPASFEIVYGHAWKVAPQRVADALKPVVFSPRRR